MGVNHSILSRRALRRIGEVCPEELFVVDVFGSKERWGEKGIDHVGMLLPSFFLYYDIHG